jgi:hypothetical protein
VRAALILAVAVAVGCATSSGPGGDAGFDDGGAIDGPIAAIDALVRPPCVEGDARVEDPLSDHCYMLFAASRDWDTAVLDCEAVGEGVHLATITGAAENAVIDNLAGNEVWIGATDADVALTFEWITGEAFAFTNWRGGEPSGGGEDCVVFQGQLSGVWDDRPCGNDHPIVCERD